LKIQILGGGCPRCNTNLKNINQALDNLRLNETVEKLINVDEIVKLGLTSTPAVIINGVVVFHGRIPAVSEIEEALQKEI
jgi:small redox-active disulfide protein 2